MILTCPACSARYRIDPASLGVDGRKVRCVKCGHSWHQTPPLPAHVAADEPPPTVERVPDAIEPPPPSSAPAEAVARVRAASTAAAEPAGRGGGRGWLVLAVVVVALIAAAVLGRNAVVRAWPPASRLYSAVGLSTEAPGNGLELRGIASKRVMDGKVPVLVIIGQIANVSHEIRDVPMLRGALHDAHDRDVQDWRFTAKSSKLKPGEVTTFETQVRNPSTQATGVLITFATNS